MAQKHRPLTDEEKARIVADRRRGKAIAWLAARYHRGEARIWQVISEAELEADCTSLKQTRRREGLRTGFLSYLRPHCRLCGQPITNEQSWMDCGLGPEHTYYCQSWRVKARHGEESVA